jgi:hypothetical protein
MKLNQLACALFGCTALTAAAPALAGMPHLDHVFVIMMENHGYGQIINNPYAPYINAEAKSANLATNYFAVAHPSLTNYLEVVGGSNFGIQDDNSPDWHNAACTPNIASLIDNNEADGTPICPIAGTGFDADTPAIDYTNEPVADGTGPVINLDGKHHYDPAPTVAMTIGDQLVAAGKAWKAYEENLPATGADLVNTSDGNFSNLTVFTNAEQALGETDGAEVALYAVKHNPFAYFASVQSGTNPKNSLANVVGYDGPTGLYADLASGHVPAYSYIVPNQCNDQHGRGNSTVFCGYDPVDDGSQAGLNPAGIALGDQEIQKLVTTIKASPVWTRGHNAIVIIWDENDYSAAPNVNQVAAIVDTSYGTHGLTSNRFYTHFSLLKSIEEAFGLACLNHACDTSTAVMTDLFQ